MSCTHETHDKLRAKRQLKQMRSAHYFGEVLLTGECEDCGSTLSCEVLPLSPYFATQFEIEAGAIV